jgi:hypothetical protein
LIYRLRRAQLDAQPQLMAQKNGSDFYFRHESIDVKASEFAMLCVSSERMVQKIYVSTYSRGNKDGKRSYTGPSELLRRAPFVHNVVQHAASRAFW